MYTYNNTVPIVRRDPFFIGPDYFYPHRNHLAEPRSFFTDIELLELFQAANKAKIIRPV